MSVEFHYYKPYEYCSGQPVSEGGVYYWGQAYSSYGKTSNSKETAMRNAFQQAADTWGSQGLGIVIGEWGVSDHWLQTYKTTIHENMSYYCKTLVAEARKRGFATFVWDNNVFGSGSEKFGIFNRKDNMTITADWTINGIMEGVAASIEEYTMGKGPCIKPRKILRNGKLLIQKGHETYTLQGYKN
jgi:endoglucanase